MTDGGGGGVDVEHRCGFHAHRAIMRRVSEAVVVLGSTFVDWAIPSLLLEVVLVLVPVGAACVCRGAVPVTVAAAVVGSVAPLVVDALSRTCLDSTEPVGQHLRWSCPGQARREL